MNKNKASKEENWSLQWKNAAVSGKETFFHFTFQLDTIIQITERIEKHIEWMRAEEKIET